VQMLDGGRWALALGYALTAVGMAVAAWVVWRGTGLGEGTPDVVGAP